MLLFIVYAVLAIYSMLCAPDVFFRMFGYRDTPEHAAFYFVFCVTAMFTLLGIAGRIVFLAFDKLEEDKT